MPTFEEMFAAAANAPTQAQYPSQDPMGYVPNAPSITQTQPITPEPMQFDPGSLNFPAPPDRTPQGLERQLLYGTALGLMQDSQAAEQRAAPGSSIPSSAPTLPDAKKNELATAQQAKQDAVNAAEQDKRVALGGYPSPEVFRNAAITKMTGAGKATTSGIEADLVNMSEYQFSLKYGDRAPGMLLAFSRAAGEFNLERSVTRSNRQAITDSVTSVASGFGNGIAGPIALLGGVLDPRLGTGAAEYINQANEAIERTKSAGAQTRARANAQVTALQDRDSLAQYEADKEKNGSTVATLQRWGREGFSAVGNAVSDPILLAEGASQAIGSLFGIGPYAKVLTKVGQAALGKAAGVAGSQTLQQAAAIAARTALIERGATMGAIGAIEGGNSYVENARSDMTHEQLMVSSPMYAGLIADGGTQDQARATVLNRAGLLAAGMTAPLAVAAGGLVSKFAGKPLRVGSLPGAARNIGLETVEEGIQGGTGTVSQNLAQQQTSNINQDISKGVGAQIGTGALYGGLAAGGLQAPGIAKQSALAAVSAAGKGALAAVNSLSDLGASKVAAQAAAATAASKVSPAIIDQAATEAVTGAPAAAVAIKDAINALDDTTTSETKAAGLAAADQITSAMTLAPDELSGLPEDVRTELLKDSPSRYKLLNRMAAALSGTEDANAPVGSMSNPSTRLDIAVAFLSAMGPLERATNNDAAMDKLEPGGSAELTLKRYRGLTANILSNTTVSAALTKAQNTLIAAQTNGQIPKITEANAVDATASTATPTATAASKQKPNASTNTLTQEAQDLVAAVDVGGRLSMLRYPVPGFINNRMRKIAKDNGVQVEATDTPLSIVNKLRAVGVNPAPTSATSPNLTASIELPLAATAAPTTTNVTYIPTDNTSKGNNNARATPLLVERIEATIAQPWSTLTESDAITADGALVGRIGAPGGITKTSYDQLKVRLKAWLGGTSVPTTSAPATTPNLVASMATTPSKAVLQTIAAASLDPLKANPASINLIASMATRGKLKLTVPQMEAVETVRAILNAAQAASAERTRLGHTTINPKTGKPSVSGVSNEALTDTTPTRGEALSANTHAKGIHNAMRTGNIEVAKEKMGDFRQFVQAMLNKLEATNANTVKPESQPGYVSWNQNTKEPYNEVSPIVRANPNSVKFAQTIAIDTQQLIDVYNGLTKAFPVLGRNTFKAATMSSLLNGTVEEVAASLQARRTGGKAVVSGRVGKVAVVAPSTAITAEAKQKKLARIAADKLKTASKIKAATRNVDPTSAATQTAGDTSVAPKAPEPVTTPLPKDLVTTSVPMTQEAVTKLSDTALDERINQLEDLDDKITSEDKVTLELLTDESQRRVETNLRETNPVVSQEPPVGDTQTAAPKTIKEQFPYVVGTWFHKAFRLKKTPSSRLVNVDSPIKAISRAFASNESLMAFTDDVYGKGIPNEVTDALGGYLNDSREIISILNKRLQDALEEKFNHTGTDGKVVRLTYRQALTNGLDVTSWINRKTMGIAQSLDRGNTHTYNPQLIESAVLAAKQWLLTASGSIPTVDARNVSGILRIEQDTVTSSMIEAFQKGYTLVAITDSITAKIKQYWGLSTNDDTGTGFTDGIPEAVAKEIIGALVAVKSITVNKIPNPEPGSPDTDVYVVKDAFENQELLGSIINGIDKAVLIKPQDIVHRDPDTIVPDTQQLNNRRVTNTPKEMKAIGIANNVSYFINGTLEAFYRAMGVKTFVDIFGNGTLTDRVLNAEHRKTLEGQNINITAAYKSFMGLVDETQYTVGDDDVTKQAHYYAHNIHKGGRLQQLGSYTPQGNPFIREVMTPTWSQLDLSDPSNVHYERFMLAMAQSLDIRIHEMSRADAIAKVQDLLANAKIQSLMDKLTEFNNTQSEFAPKGIAAIIKDALKAIGIREPTHRALSALTEYARFQDANPEQRAEFNTPLYIEADGVANGVMNSIVLLSADKDGFTKDWVDTVKSGGLYFNTFKTLGEFFSKTGKAADLYNRIVERFKFHHMNMHFATNKSPQAKIHFQAVNTMLDMFMPGFGINDKGEFVINRIVVKNPATITLYGASEAGIAANIRDALLATMYERMSEAATRLKANPNLSAGAAMFPGLTAEQTETQFTKYANAYETVTGGFVQFDPLIKSQDNPKGTWVVKGKKPNDLEPISFEKFTVDNTRLENMQKNLQYLFVSPLQKAIGDIVGKAALRGQKLLQSAVHIQSIFQQARYKDLYEKKIAEKLAKDKTFRRSHGLSQNETVAIEEQVLREMPYIKTEDQAIYPAGSNTSSMGTEYSQNLTGRMGTPGHVRGPVAAPISGSALMTFMAGDAAAVLENVTTSGATNTQWIFDGYNLALGDAERQGVEANRSVAHSWKGNPIAAVAKAFEASLEAFDMSILDADQIEQVKKALKVIIGYNAENDFQDASKALNDAGIIIQARADTLAGAGFNLDQLASQGTPYVNSGVQIDAIDDESVANILNTNLSINWNRLVKAKMDADAGTTTDPEPIITPAPDTDADPNNVVTYKIEDIEDLLRTVTLTDAQKALYGQTVLSEAIRGYTVYVGSAKELTAFASKKGFTVPTLIGADGTIHHGQTWPDLKIIYLVNPTPEVIIHELLHGATLATIHAAYRNPTSSSPAVKAAIKRLEILMDDFVKIEGSSIKNADTRETFENVLKQITTLVYNASGIAPTPNEQAVALGEFISWTLANQGLAKILVKKGETKSLGEIVRAAITAIKSFVFGVTSFPDSVFGQIAFNATIIMQDTQPTISQQYTGLVGSMSTKYGSSTRIDDLIRVFRDKISQYIETGPVDTKGVPAGQATAMLQNRKLTEGVRLLKYKKALVQAEELGNLAITQGRFDMNPQERLAFESIVSALAVESTIDPTALSEAQALYTHLARTATYQTFMVDPVANDPNDAAIGLAHYEFLMGQGAIRFDEQKRSSLMPVFMALATVHEGLRASLAKVDLPKSMKNAEGTVDARLENLANTLMDKLSQRMAGTTRTGNMQEAMDALGNRIQDLALKQKNIIEQLAAQGGTAADSANARVSEMLKNTADAVVGAAERLSANKPSSKVRKTAEHAARVIMSIVSEKQGKVVAEGVMAALNSTGRFDFIRNLASDMFGRNDLNKDVFDHTKKVRAHVEQNRQHYREILPTKIAEEFSRKLEDKVWSTIYKAVWSTDLAAITARDIAETVLNMVTDPNLLAQRKATLEASIQASDPAHWNLIQTKSRQLANYMNTKELGHELLPNAYAVSRLYGQRIQPGRAVPNAAMVENIDSLISVYAYEALAQDQKDTITKLVKDEKKGMILVLSYLQGQRKDEMVKASKGRARDNHIKGYAPSLPTEGRNMMVADDARAAELSKLGYTRVGDYAGSSLERGGPSRGYYYAPIQARMTFSQGSLQNIQQTASGVHPELGFSVDQTAGRITSTSEINSIRRRGKEASGNPEALRPIWDATGKIVAYERTLDPAQLARLGHDTHAARMIGVDRGRQVEEAEAHIFNEQLMHALKDMYDKDTQAPYKNASQYVNLNNIFETSKDPVLTDALNLITKESWAYGQTIFGGPVMVRRDFLKDVVGHRKASLTDSWNGISRFNPTTQAHIRNIATLVMGKDAYKWILIGETEIRSLVTNAKQIIVVKSVIIPALNIISNLMHMTNRGVPLATIFRLMPKKLIEVHNYTKNFSRRIEVEMQLRTVEHLPFEARRLQAVLQSIDDANRRMTIWPLIEAGEFSSISDAGISRDELLLTQGRMSEYFSKLVDKLPQPVRDAGRHAFIAKDTALFQGLTKAVQYGDFLAKAIMYDDMLTRQNKSKEEALGVITEEFVNYDRLLGRTHEYLEDIGLSWFYKYKIRSIKVALSVIRNNPLNALLSSLIPMPDMLSNAGTPLSDNLVSKAISGTLPYSMGPGMGFYAPGLHPVSQAIGMLR